MVLNLVGTIFALLLIGCGLVLLPLPIPLGAVCIISGAGLAVAVNPTARAWVQGFRARNDSVENVIVRVKPYLPKILHGPLDDSDPGSASRKL